MAWLHKRQCIKHKSNAWAVCVAVKKWQDVIVLTFRWNGMKPPLWNKVEKSKMNKTLVLLVKKNLNYLFINLSPAIFAGFFYSFFTHKKCPIMFIMLHSSSITLYYHYFHYCSILKISLFFIFFISFHPIISMLFAQIQQIEHYGAFFMGKNRIKKSPI